MPFITSRYTISGDFEFRSGRYPCFICGKEATNPTRPRLCPDHLPQFVARQRAGVTTDELSRRWADCLDNWLERPPELDVELGVRGTSTLFHFAERDGDWVLFERGYGSRPPDGLAVNLRTGEVRRFVAMWTEEILDDLHGVRPASTQAELMAHWGRPDPIPDPIGVVRPPMPAELEQGPPLSLPVHLPFPVYGLADHPLGLTVCSISQGRTSQQFTSFGLTFTSPRYPDVRENFELVSLDAKNPWLASQPTVPPAAPALWQGEVQIAGQVLKGEMHRWSVPQEFAQMLPAGLSRPAWEMFYELKGEETNLSGKVHGPSVEEVLELLQGAVVINQRANLLEQYQRELDEESKRLFGE